MNETVPLHFWTKVRETFPRSPFRCWEWTSVIGKDGYGVMKISKKNEGAHRVSWRLNKGEIPPGLCVLHRCDNPICVRPSHLFLGTKSDNTRDAIFKGRFKIPNNRRKTHCKRGHEFTFTNTAINRKGERHCRECVRLRSAARQNGRKLPR